jgi:hypothetical protein
MTLALVKSSRCSNVFPTYQLFTPRRTHMLIKDLSKELDSSAMAAIQGGRPIAPGLRYRTLTPLPGLVDPIGPYGTNGFVLPEGAAD